jgi:hypothetical protein
VGIYGRFTSWRRVNHRDGVIAEISLTLSRIWEIRVRGMAIAQSLKGPTSIHSSIAPLVPTVQSP